MLSFVKKEIIALIVSEDANILQKGGIDQITLYQK
jgi:hypothetical protein